MRKLREREETYMITTTITNLRIKSNFWQCDFCFLEIVLFAKKKNKNLKRKKKS